MQEKGCICSWPELWFAFSVQTGLSQNRLRSAFVFSCNNLFCICSVGL